MRYPVEESRIVLYSMREDSCHYLPQMPPFEGDFCRRECQFVSLDSKIYCVGGDIDKVPITEMHTLDLSIGEKQWKRCKNMTYPRLYFGYCVVEKFISVGAKTMNAKPCVMGKFTILKTILGLQ